MKGFCSWDIKHRHKHVHALWLDGRLLRSALTSTQHTGHWLSTFYTLFLPPALQRGMQKCFKKNFVVKAPAQDGLGAALSSDPRRLWLCLCRACPGFVKWHCLGILLCFPGSAVNLKSFTIPRQNQLDVEESCPEQTRPLLCASAEAGGAQHPAGSTHPSASW